MTPSTEKQTRSLELVRTPHKFSAIKIVPFASTNYGQKLQKLDCIVLQKRYAIEHVNDRRQDRGYRGYYEKSHLPKNGILTFKDNCF